MVEPGPRTLTKDEVVRRNLIAPRVWVRAYDELLRTAILAHVTGEPVIGKIELSLTEHAGPRVHLGAQGSFSSPMQMEAYEASLSITAIAAFDLSAHKLMIAGVAAQHVNAQRERLKGGVSQSAEISGTAVKPTGNPIEDLLEMARRVDWSFDRAGNVQMHDLLVDGDAAAQEKARALYAQLQVDPRFEALIAERRAQVMMRRNSRRTL